jgi:hypothetical protein
MSVCLGMTASTLAQGRQAAPPPAGTKTTPAPAAAPATTDLAVTVTYTGKGVVDASHQILLFLFTDPNIQTSQPIAGPQIATKNGASVTFKNVTAKSVYVAAVYNEKGTYSGTGGPPPTGTPIGMYSKDAKAPTAVTPGAKVPIKLSFSDAKRFDTG